MIARFWHLMEALRLVLRQRGAIPQLLTAAEELVLVIDTSDPLDMRDIHSLNPLLYRAMADVANTVRPQMNIRIIRGAVEE
jgi:hypothetical protein